MDNWNKAQKLYKIYQFFLSECHKRNIQFVTPKLAHDYMYLLACNPRDGLNLEAITPCKAEYFINSAIDKLMDPLNPTTISFQIKYFFTSRPEVEIDYIKHKYNSKFEIQLQDLIEIILRCPQTTNAKQIDQMFKHIQIFIIAAYSLGSPKDHILLDQTAQSLRSVISRDDLQNYVMKVRFNRLEYLKRLSATVSGILIYNNQDPNGNKDHMRDVLIDLEMAERNTKDAINAGLERANRNIAVGSRVLEENLLIDTQRQRLHINVHSTKLHRLNRYLICFHLYHRYINKLNESYEKVSYLVKVGKNKMKCVIDKINEILKIRTAIQSELIFPHFVYLSELWLSFVLYFNYLVELNKIKDAIDAYLPLQFDKKLEEAIQTASLQYEPNDIQKDFTFAEIYDKITPIDYIEFTDFKEPMKSYCTLTLSLTNGIVIPARIARKQSKNLDIEFGYRDAPSSTYALRYFSQYSILLKYAVVQSVDVILLFNLEDVVLKDVVLENAKPKCKQQAVGTQTYMCVKNDVSAPNWVNVTWNIWDYYREIIHLADLRKKRTHSCQTNVSYGQRNAQNQAYYTRKHFGN